MADIAQDASGEIIRATQQQGAEQLLDTGTRCPIDVGISRAASEDTDSPSNFGFGSAQQPDTDVVCPVGCAGPTDVEVGAGVNFLGRVIFSGLTRTARECGNDGTITPRGFFEDLGLAYMKLSE